MEIVLKADKNVCEISGWQSNTGEVNVRSLTVEMCEEMCSCAMAFVTFKLKDGTVYESLVVNGKADIPTIDKAQFVEIGVYSADIEDNVCVKRYSPHPTTQYVNAGSYSGKAATPPTPTPSDFEKIIETINSKGHIENITKDTYINELENGVYRCSLEGNAALLFDSCSEYGLIDGIAIVTHIVESSEYRWLTIGTDYPNWMECTRIGVSVLGDDGLLSVESVKDLGSALTTDDVLQALNDSTDNEPQKVYSANAINEEVVKPTTMWFNKLVAEKENISNKSTSIDNESTDKEYSTAKAVYDFGLRIIEAHQEQVDAQMNELEERLMSGVEALIGGIENGSY